MRMQAGDAHLPTFLETLVGMCEHLRDVWLHIPMNPPNPAHMEMLVVAKSTPSIHPQIFEGAHACASHVIRRCVLFQKIEFII